MLGKHRVDDQRRADGAAGPDNCPPVKVGDGLVIRRATHFAAPHAH